MRVMCSHMQDSYGEIAWPLASRSGKSPCVPFAQLCTMVFAMLEVNLEFVFLCLLERGVSVL